jgi:uncharacterized repeat protein (TIGR04052 family)
MKKLLFSFPFVALVGCASVTPSSTEKVQINFVAQINGDEFSCGKSYSNIGVTKATITPTDYRFYVSNVRLINAQGKSVPVELEQDGIWQYKNLALLDFEDGSGPCRNGTAPKNVSIRGAVPKGDYKGMQLTIGVPFELNHGDSTIAPSPLNSTAMFWSWQGGYKFIKFDAQSSGAIKSKDGKMPGFSLHLGSTHCASDSQTKSPTSCANSNRVDVSFSSFNPATQVVVFDMGKLLTEANVDVNTPKTAPGCMSGTNDPDCNFIMHALGITFNGKPGSVDKKFIFIK